MVTEEVEPGVLRIRNDGYRDLWHRDRGFDPFKSDAIVVGTTGVVWRIAPPHRFHRLGEQAMWRFDPDVMLMSQFDTEAGPDGRLWTEAYGGLRVFDGEDWSDGGIDGEEGVVGGDGTVWAIGEERLVGTLPGGEGFVTSGWSDVYDGEVFSRLAVSDGGEAWLVGWSQEGDDARPHVPALRRQRLARRACAR